MNGNTITDDGRTTAMSTETTGRATAYHDTIKDVWPAQPCDGCEKPVIPCAAVASHIGCSSARGYIHQGSGAHSCEPRSGAPYAHPVSLRSDIGEVAP